MVSRSRTCGTRRKPLGRLEGLLEVMGGDGKCRGWYTFEELDGVNSKLLLCPSYTTLWKNTSEMTEDEQ